MADDIEFTTRDEDVEWGKRRKNMRHDVDVAARILGNMGIVIDCQICDISSSGMLLSYEFLVPEGGQEPLKIGSTVKISFNPDVEHDPDYSVTVEVEIMWKTPHGIGVHFTRLDQEQKDALRQLALAAIAEREKEQEKKKEVSKGTEPHLNKAAIMKDCRKTLERHLPNMIWTMRTEVVRRLRVIADDDNEQREEALKDAEIVEAKSNAIGRAIERQLMLAVAELSGLDDTQELLIAPAQSKVVAMATGNTEAVKKEKSTKEKIADTTRSPSFRSAIQFIDDKLKSRVFELNVRLAGVLARKLETDTNPILPMGLTATMWDAVTQYAGGGRMQMVLREVFKTRILPLLSDLYGELHKTLDKHEVPGAFRAK